MRSVRSRTSLGYRLSCPGRLCSVHHNESSLALISIARFQYHARKHLQLSERVLRSLRRHQSSGVSGRHRRAHAACGNQLGREAIGRHGWIAIIPAEVDLLQLSQEHSGKDAPDLRHREVPVVPRQVRVLRPAAYVPRALRTCGITACRELEVHRADVTTGVQWHSTLVTSKPLNPFPTSCVQRRRPAFRGTSCKILDVDSTTAICVGQVF